MFPPILYSPGSDDAARQRISRAARKGELRGIAAGLYTSDLTSPIEQVAERHAYDIAALLYPGAVVGYRTALEGGIRDHGAMFLTHARPSKAVPGVAFRTAPGPGPLVGDMRLGERLHVAGVPRLLLENLTPSRTRQIVARSAGRAAVEAYLDRWAASYGSPALNTLREDARNIAPALGLDREQRRLDQIISALLGTGADTRPATAAGRARAAGAPIDSARLQQCERLAAKLHGADYEQVPAPHLSMSADAGETYWQNAAFFESYFSNYIEGTEFALEEARAIVYDGQIPSERRADAYDILGLFRVIADQAKAMVAPGGGEVFLAIVRQRHAEMFAGRPDIGPGRFKRRPNRAGGYAFVLPELVGGTLKAGLKIGRGVQDPVGRALYMHFLVSEVHPFADGNGRVARVLMNAELSSAGLARAIIPNVLRDDYLAVVRLLSREGDADPLARLILKAQQLYEAIPFQDYAAAQARLIAGHAFDRPEAGHGLVLPDGLERAAGRPGQGLGPTSGR